MSFVIALASTNMYHESSNNKLPMRKYSSLLEIYKSEKYKNTYQKTFIIDEKYSSLEDLLTDRSIYYTYSLKTFLKVY